MIKNAVEYTDLLYHAQSLGYKWNETCDLFRKDQLYDRKHLYLDDLNEMCILSDDTKKILISFMNENNIDECRLVID